MKGVLRLTIFLFVCMLIYSIIGFVVYMDATVLYKHKFSFNDFKNDTLAITIDSIKISEKLAACEIALHIDLSMTTKYEGYANVDIFDDEDTLVGQIEGDIYYDFGTDSDGAWSERKKEIAKNFRLEDGGGKFRAEVYFAKSKGFDVYNPESNPVCELIIYKPDRLLSEYFLYTAIFSSFVLFFLIIFTSKKQK